MGKMGRQKTIKIGDMVYWSSGDDLGECDSMFCRDKAFSFNGDGSKFCEECLEKWHGEQDRKAKRIPIEKEFQCKVCESVHAERGRAEDCCNHVEEVYRCPECSDEHETEEDAHECCEMEIV